MQSKRLFVTLALGLGVTLVGLILALMPARITWAQGDVIYVDADATAGAGSGLSWTDAYTNLQDALDNAPPGDEIWVAEGVYTPTNTSDRGATFQLVNGVALYGGFGATETLRSQRNWETHATVLSGDLAGDDVTDANHVVTSTTNISGTDNAYHVVTGSGVTGTAVLDGFIVTAGNATGGAPHDRGAGMVNNNGRPTVRNVTFSGNDGGSWGGGGMANYNGSNPTLINVTFSNNSAEYGGGMANDNSDPMLAGVTFSGNATDVADGCGGGLFNMNSSPVLTDVIFSGNHADYGGGVFNDVASDPTLINVAFSGNYADYGGGTYNLSSSPTLINVTFSSNSATDYGGGMINDASNPALVNCILWGNTAGTSGAQITNTDTLTPTISYSLVQGSGGSSDWDTGLGTDGGGNIDADPLFVDLDGADDVTGTLDDDLRLLPTSPAIDAGNNFSVTVATDLDGHPRLVDIPGVLDSGNGVAPIVDMGAYETQGSDLRIQKTVITTSVAPGATITYTLTFSNVGRGLASAVVITDRVPASVTAVRYSSSGAAVDATGSISYVWNVENLGRGDWGVITITGALSDVLPAGTFVNTAVITGTADVTPTNNSDDDEGVTVPNLAPVAANDGGGDYTTDEDSAFTTGNVLLNDEDPNGDSLVVDSFDDSGTAGTVTDNGDGTFDYNPNGRFEYLAAGEVVSDTFAYTVSDGGGLTDTATVAITVSGVNDAPSISSIPDQSTRVGVTVGPIPFTVGDVDTPTETLSLGRTSSNTALVTTTNILFGGSGAARSVTITPTAGMTGTATITITVSDGDLDSHEAFVLAVEPFRVYLPLILRY